MQCNDDIDRAEAGRRLGYDLFRYRWTPPRQERWRDVQEGFCQARDRCLPSVHSDRFQRKWMQLRLSAHRRGRSFDQRITPDLLRQMDVERCPITRQVLTHGELTDTDWSVDRINNDGGYAANNLAVMSRRANLAKGSCTFDEVARRSVEPDATDDLEPIEWLRFAALMLGPCFVEAPQRAPLVPMIVAPPPGSVRLGSQLVQDLFARDAARSAGKNALIRHFCRAAPDAQAEARLRQLAEAVHQGLKGLEPACDVWLRPGVMTALVRWWEPLDGDARGRAGEIARVLSHGRHVSGDRLRSWKLDSKGYAYR